MPGAQWFPGAHLNYAEHIFRRFNNNEAALVFASEDHELSELGWQELAAKVNVLSRWLRHAGLMPGDRVAAYLTNSPQAVIAMLATVSAGGVWTACSPDLGIPSVLDRFSQLQPRFLFCVDGYRYGGKSYSRRREIRELVAGLPSLEATILVPNLDGESAEIVVDGAESWDALFDAAADPQGDIEFTQVPFAHPLWILFSSGTTGLPKAIVHSHGGILLEQLKLSSLHMNLKAGDREFFYTTLGWMMWNFLVGSMLLGVVPVLYDGTYNFCTW
jgi:acetoacetyl-CoA synthetase